MDLLYRETAHTAQKEHDCSRCDYTIYPGETYTTRFGQYEWDDKPRHEKLCSSCHTPPAKCTTPETDGYDYIRNYYGAPVEVGQTVECDGKRGTVLPAKPSHAHYLRVKAEGEKHPGLWHPTWETVYYNQDGSIAADYRKAKPVEAERQAV